MASGTGLIYHPDVLQHPSSPGGPERPERVTSIMRVLEEKRILGALKEIKPKPCTIAEIKAVHDPEQVEMIESTCQKLHDPKALDQLDSDVSVGEHSFEAARLASGGAIEACKNVAEGSLRDALCVIRPPGHHAEKKRAMGFCMINHAAIAARYLQRIHNYKKVLIFDWDVHHGNGTQDIFYDDPSVFFASIHQYPFYPGTGASTETGKGDGVGYTLNMPVGRGQTNEDYMRILTTTLAPAIRRYKPEFIIVSAGFDAHHADPLGGMKIDEEGFAQMTILMKELAEDVCGGRLVSLLEGGYNLSALAQSVASHLQALRA